VAKWLGKLTPRALSSALTLGIVRSDSIVWSSVITWTMLGRF
jgi:hypothetical protein